MDARMRAVDGAERVVHVDVGELRELARETLVVRFLLGHRVVAYRTLAVQANCTFSTPVSFRRLVDRTPTQLTVVAHFRGNSYLRSASSRGQRVGLG